MMNEPIHTIMTKQVITLHPESTLSEVRVLLLDRRIHHVPIVEGDNQLVGMISSWDMFKSGKSAEDMADIKVREIMTTKLATLGQDEHIGAVAELLMEHLFHAVPIVNDQHQLIGIVTSYDMLRYEYRKEYPENLEKFIPENM